MAERSNPNTTTPAFVFAHGWGMQNEFFRPLIEHLNCAALVFCSRDYFANAARHDPDSPEGVTVTSHVEEFNFTNTPWIGIGHSYGFMRLASLHLKNCQGLISLNGFTRFCGESGTSRKTVEAMIAKLQKAPIETVNGFRSACGASSLEPTLIANAGLLLHDLKTISSHHVSGETLAAVPVVALVAADDQIVPQKMACQQFNGCGAGIHVCPGGGHLLGNTFPDWCSQQIRDFVSTLNFDDTPESAT